MRTDGIDLGKEKLVREAIWHQHLGIWLHSDTLDIDEWMHSFSYILVFLSRFHGYAWPCIGSGYMISFESSYDFVCAPSFWVYIR